MHKGAQMVTKEFGGNMPSDIKSLRRIPGIGEYTAGAIASVAFNVSTPVVDGNVVRVFSRYAVRHRVLALLLLRFTWRTARTG